ncbi:MAG: hypothetical protein ACYC35_08615 [Pirellulales bacterium]
MTSTPSDDPARQVRLGAYLLFIVIGTGSMLGHILAVNSVDRIALEKHLQSEKRPNWQQQRAFLSANDRSRWCTVRALVEHGTYAIDKVIAEPNWDTIDMVKHDGRLYSSKPPLLATLVAGEYWVIHRLTGATLGTHPYEIGRFMLVTINVVPLVLYFVLLAALVERYGRTDWGRMFVMASAVFGTFLPTFAVSLNNHLPAAVSVLIALYAALRIWYDGRREWWYFALAGFFAAFTAANELPAASFAALLSVALLWKAPRQTLLAYVPAAAVVTAAFFGTNYIAHQSLRPPYAHRGASDNWYDYTYQRDGKTRPSYWLKPDGIDRGEPSSARYALHVLVGHHGIFSLTPIWLLSVVGLGLLAFQRQRRLWELAVLIGVVSAVCLAFYLARPLADRNYGGMNAGFRWVFWFAPLWLLAMLPAADAAARRRWTRGLALVLLAVSVLSATYPTWNPWTQPWLYNWFASQGWLPS